MRIVHWLFLVSVALFISGIGFIVAGARTAQGAEVVDAPAMTPVATVKQIMNGIVAPAATTVVDAVGTIVNADGVLEIAPKNEEEWAAVGNSAAALVESGNLLMLGDRAVDRGEWVAMSRALTSAGIEALKAAEGKDKDALLAAGSVVNTACDNCHQKYQRQ